MAIRTKNISFDAPIPLPSYTLATVPSASNFTGGMAYITDAPGGAVPVFSDGTNWRSVIDRSIVV